MKRSQGLPEPTEDQKVLHYAANQCWYRPHIIQGSARQDTQVPILLIAFHCIYSIAADSHERYRASGATYTQVYHYQFSDIQHRVEEFMESQEIDNSEFQIVPITRSDQYTLSRFQRQPLKLLDYTHGKAVTSIFLTEILLLMFLIGAKSGHLDLSKKLGCITVNSALLEEQSFCAFAPPPPEVEQEPEPVPDEPMTGQTQEDGQVFQGVDTLDVDGLMGVQSVQDRLMQAVADTIAKTIRSARGVGILIPELRLRVIVRYWVQGNTGKSEMAQYGLGYHSLPYPFSHTIDALLATPIFERIGATVRHVPRWKVYSLGEEEDGLMRVLRERAPNGIRWVDVVDQLPVDPNPERFVMDQIGQGNIWRVRRQKPGPEEVMRGDDVLYIGDRKDRYQLRGKPLTLDQQCLSSMRAMWSTLHSDSSIMALERDLGLKSSRIFHSYHRRTRGNRDDKKDWKNQHIKEIWES